jgi:SAM-dependent methyltransferase
VDPLALIKAGWRMLHWRELRATVAYCPICEARRAFVRLKNDEMAARCLTCRGSAVSLSIVSVLRKVATGLREMDVYELSSRGPLYQYLKVRAGKLTVSEYFHDVPGGQFRGAIQCQDVQQLTYADASFDICTSTEVFEHVPDDAKAFSEIFRVLRPKGLLVFTVPLYDERETVERACVTTAGEVRHLLPPEYHGDPLRGVRILAFRRYGSDITQRLRNAGFVDAQILLPNDRIPWGYARPVITAFKAPTGQVSAASDSADRQPGTRAGRAS